MALHQPTASKEELKGLTPGEGARGQCTGWSQLALLGSLWRKGSRCEPERLGLTPLGITSSPYACIFQLSKPCQHAIKPHKGRLLFLQLTLRSLELSKWTLARGELLSFFWVLSLRHMDGGFHLLLKFRKMLKSTRSSSLVNMST